MILVVVVASFQTSVTAQSLSVDPLGLDDLLDLNPSIVHGILLQKGFAAARRDSTADEMLDGKFIKVTYRPTDGELDQDILMEHYCDRDGLDEKVYSVTSITPAPPVSGTELEQKVAIDGRILKNGYAISSREKLWRLTDLGGGEGEYVPSEEEEHLKAQGAELVTFLKTVEESYWVCEYYYSPSFIITYNIHQNWD